ncbi:hypothetical protein NDU88_002901, partial [Pleurodeles waltl]
FSSLLLISASSKFKQKHNTTYPMRPTRLHGNYCPIQLRSYCPYVSSDLLVPPHLHCGRSSGTINSSLYP